MAGIMGYSGYTQAELDTMFQRSDNVPDVLSRQYADLIAKFQASFPTWPNDSAGTAEINFQVKKYLGNDTRVLVEVATALYGQTLTPTTLVTAIKNMGYADPWATNIVDVLISIYALLPSDLGAECITAGTTFATGTAAGDFAVGSSALTFTKSTGAGTFTQTESQMVGTPAAISVSQWYKFDYEYTAVPATAANFTSLVITATGGIPLSSKDIRQTVAGKYTGYFYSATAQSTGHDLILTCAASDTCVFTLDNISLRKVASLGSGAAYSTNPLATTYVKPSIARIVQNMAYLLRQGELAVYNR